MPVPFVDPERLDQPLMPEFEAALRRVVSGGRYIGGAEVEAFERTFALWLKVDSVVGTSSGADALLLALRALDVRQGDRVVVPAISSISAPQAVVNAGGEPVFVDITPDTLTLDPAGLSEALRYTRRMKAVIVDHLFGQPADMPAILELAAKRNVPVVEIAFHALGSTIGDVPAGTLGAVGCFSFHPARNLGALGEAGALATNDDMLAARLRTLADRGRIGPYRHSQIGLSARMDAFQAAVLSAKVKYLQEWNEKRVEAAEYYRRRIVERGLTAVLTPPPMPPSGRAVHNHFVCRAIRRDEMREFLAGKGIETEVFYPLPLHLQECFRRLGYREGDFKVAEKTSGLLLALPFHAILSRSEQDYVIEAVSVFFRRKP